MKRFLKRWAWAWFICPIIIVCQLVHMLTLGSYYPIWDFNVMFWVSNKRWMK